jgi:hypothetical protein
VKLLTDANIKALPPIGSTASTPDPVAVVKFFDPTGSWSWYATEGKQEGDDYRFYGVVCGYERELGYWMLSDLQRAKAGIAGLGGLPIERDLYFKPTPLSECKW